MAHALSTRVALLPFQGGVLLGAFLLFTLELIMGRLLLPPFGSSAAVWTTSLMVWQGLLLLGYLFGARATRWIAGRRYRWQHALLLVLPLVSFPFHLRVLELPPVLAISVALLLAPGAAFVVLSTTSVLAQAFLHQSGGDVGRDPSFLYAWSNWGALLALLTYPFVIEPALGLAAQLQGWYGLYGLYAVLLLLCIRIAGGGARSQEGETPEPPREPTLQTSRIWSLRLLSAGANALLMAVTHTVTQDAPMPLLWVLPLSVYLLTLILAFGTKPLDERSLVRWVGLSGLGVLGAVVWMAMGKNAQAGLALIHVSILWAGCLLCHVNLVRQKPTSPQGLGRFYLEIALGGFLGSVGVGLVLPWVFFWLASYLPDYALAMGCVVGGYVARDLNGWKTAWKRPGVRAGVGLLGGLLLSALFLLGGGVLKTSVASVRTFYGIYRVRDVGEQRQLLHGNTVHGIQWRTAGRSQETTAYYHPRSPVGEVFHQPVPTGRVALVGLGIGTLMAYARPGEQWDGYELDGEVETLARDHFSFIGSSPVALPVRLGDARQQLPLAPDATYDLIVMDTFSSDAIPLHLLTAEAMNLYLQKLKPTGILLFHVSSRLFELRPVLRAHALARGLSLLEGDDGPLLRGNDPAQTGIFPSVWVALARAPETLAPLRQSPVWKQRPLEDVERTKAPWTDDQQELLEVVR